MTTAPAFFIPNAFALSTFIPASFIPGTFAPGTFIPDASATGTAIANHLWQSTAFASAVWLLTLLLRRNPARIRHALWLAASLKFLLPFSLLIGIGTLLPAPRHTLIEPQPVLYSTMDSMVQPFSPDTIAPPAKPHVATTKERLTAALPTILAAIWLIGAATVLLIWYIRWRQIASTLKISISANDSREASLLHHLQTRTGAHTNIDLRHSPQLTEPGIIGIFRPVLLWPTQLSDHLEDAHIEAILAHELTHARRRDNLTAALHMLVEAIFWFHPIVWWIERRLIEERERACDESVVHLTGQPGLYAESLLKTCRFCLESPLPCVSGITGADLSQRVRSIMTMRLERLSAIRKLLLVTVGVTVTAGPVVFGLIGSPLRALVTEAQTLASDWMRAAGGKQQFDAASIRQNVSGAPPAGDAQRSTIPLGSGDVHGASEGFFRATNFTLFDYLVFAYKLTDYQEDLLRSTAPGWITQERFNIEARTENRSATKDQMRLMMQSLLTERFHLAVHYEERQTPVFALTPVLPGATGPKLQPHPAAASCTGYPPPAPAPEASPAKDQPETTTSGFPTVCGGIVGVHASAVDRYSFGGRNVPLNMIASVLSSWGHLGRPVVNRTGLNGPYDFVLEFTPDPPPAYANGTDSGGPTFQEALKQQLGMKLEPQKAPVEFLVIDHLDHLSDNFTAPQPAAAQASTDDWQKAAGGKLQFDVASIREDKSDREAGANFVLGPGNAYATTGGRFAAFNLPVLDYIRFAYKLTNGQAEMLQSQAPKWISSDKFDIEATSANHNPAKDQMRLMMQSLLADRFNLRVHTESKDLPVFAMELSSPGKLGPQLRQHPADDSSCSNLTPSPQPDSPKTPTTVPGGFPVTCGGIVSVGAASAPSHIRVGARNIPLTLLASNLGGFDRPLQDRTGLTGTYDLILEWASNPKADDGPNLQVALEEQLGIKLKPAKAPVDILVVDHIDHPSDNFAASQPVTTQNQVPKAQTASAAIKIPKFEAVSVRQSTAGTNDFHIRFTPDGFSGENGSVLMLMRMAWMMMNSLDDKFIGAPGWIKSDRYTIQAKVDPSDIDVFRTLDHPQRGLMLQTLLEDRFHLKTHQETREQPVYNLVVAKSGLRLNHAKPEDQADIAGSGGDAEKDHSSVHTTRGHLEAKDIRMADLEIILTQLIGRTVLDKTDITGKYDVTLNWTPEEQSPTSDNPASDSAGPSIFTALQEQLGLKLAPAKAPVEVLVIDHVERPSEN